MLRWSITFYTSVLLCGLISLNSLNGAFGQIAYRGHLSDERIKELERIAILLNHSILKKYQPCDKYYEYVCHRHQQMFTVMGNLPTHAQLIYLSTDLQNDPQNFEAKRKLMDFFLSCNIVKSIDDCYRETFQYFRPIYGYIVANNHLEPNDHNNLIDLLQRFIDRAKNTQNFGTYPLKNKLEEFKEKFKYPRAFFQIYELDKEYKNVRIYRDGYEQNIKSLQEMRASNNRTFSHAVPKTILDWTLYMFQSRNKPMSYYMSTLNVHLWMMFYNISTRNDEITLKNTADCLKLPSIINGLEEARTLAVVYIKSFQQAWAEYRDWIRATAVNQEIYDHETTILRPYNLDNKQLFFTLYAQTFCDFGKEIAENVFFLGLKQNVDFYNVYSCGHVTTRGADCI